MGFVERVADEFEVERPERLDGALKRTEKFEEGLKSFRNIWVEQRSWGGDRGTSQEVSIQEHDLDLLDMPLSALALPPCYITMNGIGCI